MRSIYTIPFIRRVLISDHWSIPFLDGVCRIIENDGYASALEITFHGEPIENSPKVEDISDGRIKLHITGRDDRLPVVKYHVEHAMAYLECFYGIDLDTENIEIKYEGETAEEEDSIDLKGFKTGRNEAALPLTFDMITRAFMAAELSEGPKLQSTLAKAARASLISKAYVDSFRYSFLLIEFLYGGGKFKSNDLKSALNGNREFLSLLDRALKNVMPPNGRGPDDTVELLKRNPNSGNVIAHLVEKRGLYFHGNAKRPNAWKPDDQSAAEGIALLGVSIAQEISQQAADPIFNPEFAERHYRDAMNAGAKVVFDVQFKFREPEEEFSRDGRMSIATPGTKVTGKQANAVAQQFLKLFEHDAPAAKLESASCTVKGEKVFDLIFHVG